MPQVIAEGVTKTYAVDGAGLDAVRDVSISIEKGEFVSIIGHSGSGKTTLLSLIAGLARPTRGRVLFDGTDIFSLDSNGLADYRCEKIGFIFQFASLLPMLTAMENLLLPAGFRSSPSGAVVQRAKELLTMVGLGDRLGAYPSRLSGGQQRRVAIARAFMNEPAMVLADEPTGDLDEETEAEMMSFFTSMNRERNITFLLVTHNTDLAKKAGRQMRMHGGTLQDLRG